MQRAVGKSHKVDIGVFWRLVIAVALCLGAATSSYAQSQSLFTTQTPAIASASDGVPYELGLKLRLAQSGNITAIRYWKATGDSGTHVGRLWSSDGALLASTTFVGETASGWQQQALTTAVTVQPGTTYVVSVNIATNFPFTNNGLASPIVNGDLSSVADGNNGLYGTASSFPDNSFQSSNYFRDVVFVPATVGVPAKLALSPATGNTQSGVPVSYTATIRDANGNTVTTATNAISFSVSGVTGSFNPASPVTPSNGAASTTLTPTTSSTATITASATGLTSATAVLTVSAPSGGAGQSLFTTQTPVIANANDGVPYELGMKFQVATSGVITAVRYWKASGDTGTHVGRIWSATGALLAATTFSNETASGWQQQALSSALPVQAGTTYVVSTNIGSRYPFTFGGLQALIVNGQISSVADGNNGVYGTVAFAFPSNSYQSSNYFRDIVFIPDVTAGPPAKLALQPLTSSTQTNSPVTFAATIQDADGNTVVAATNGVTFTVSGVTGFFNPSTVETPLSPSRGVATSAFTPTSAGTATIAASSQGLGSAVATVTVAQGPSAPTKVLLLPAVSSTQTGVPVTYSAQLQDANGDIVTTAGNAVTFSVSGVSGAFSPASPVTPSSGIATTALTATTPGTATVTASVAGLTSGNATVMVSGNTTLGPESLFTTQTPVLLNAADGVGYELGMKLQFARSGRITAIRYWKSAGDSGTHIGKIWSAGGTLLSSATFSGGSASGWQQQSLPTALTVTANTTYVVSVNINTNYPFTASGLASSIIHLDIMSVSDGSNGVFGSPGAFPSGAFQNSNYFRDVVFVADAIPEINKAGGDNQSGSASTPLPSPLAVLVRDANNNPLPNVTVTFALTSGAGSVSPATAVTGANGQAATTLTLGASGRTLVSANAAGIGSVTFSAFVPNAIYSENQQTGTTAWSITNYVSSTSPEIVGYASAPSVNRGGTLDFKVSLAQTGQYTIDVYRLGYYSGAGGRLISHFGPLSGIAQGPCGITDPATLLIECNWNTSFTLAVGSNWTSGIYVANLTEPASGKQSQVWFVVRDDAGAASLLFQSSFSTFVAYNNYGDSEQHSLYEYNSTSGQRAYKVSLDRPFSAASVFPFENNNPLLYEHHMVRWLEAQGYDVSYTTNLDVHLNSSALLQHKAYLSVGHDEYWSLEMRNGVEQALAAGVNLGFFSANTAYWRVRFEPSPTTGLANRVMVCYKDPAVGDPIAPTYQWRGPENNRPENGLLGVMYVGDNDSTGGFEHVVTNATDPYYNNTGLTNNTGLLQLVGYEWDAVVNNGATPPGLVVLSSSPTIPLTIAPGLPPGTNSGVANAVRYTASSGGKVFSAATIQFAWGLDSEDVSPPRADSRLQQFVINVLSDLGAKPVTPSSGMVVP